MAHELAKNRLTVLAKMVSIKKIILGTNNFGKHCSDIASTNCAVCCNIRTNMPSLLPCWCRRQKGFFSLAVEDVLHWKKKWSHFDLKSWVTGGTEIRSGIPSNWRIFESNWLDIESEIDSILRVNLTQIFDLILRLDK